MQRIVSIFVFCLAVAINAQSRLGVVNTFTSGTTVHGSITNTATTPFPTAPDVYAFWVPNNAETVIATLSNTGPDGCNYLDLLVNLNSVPCSNEDFPDTAESYFCSFAAESFYSSEGSTESETYTADDSSYGWEFATGVYWYFGVRTESTYANLVCSYSLSINVNTSCAADSIAVIDYNDNAACYPEMNVTNNFNYTTTVPTANAGTYAQLFHTVLPQNVGNVNIFIQSSIDLEVYTKSHSGASYYNEDCEADTSSNSGNNYTASFSCPVPLPGDFYITVQNPSSSTTAFTYTIMVTTNVCSAGTAGAFCAYPLTMLTLSNFTSGGSVTYKNISEYRNDNVNGNDYNFRYFAFNTQNFTASSPAIAISAISDNYAYLDVRTDNAPYYDVYYYSYSQIDIYGSTPEVFYYVYADYLVPNHIQYFGVHCYSSYNCNITLSWNATNLIDITTTATTGTSSTGASTTGVTGASTTGATGVSTTTGTTAVTGTVTTAVTGTVVTTGSASTLAASLAAVFVAALLI